VPSKSQTGQVHREGGATGAPSPIGCRGPLTIKEAPPLVRSHLPHKKKLPTGLLMPGDIQINLFHMTKQLEVGQLPSRSRS